MLNLFNKHKFGFVIFSIIFSPVILFLLTLYGLLIGFTGGLVWGYEKLKKVFVVVLEQNKFKFVLTKFVFKFFYFYVSCLICLLAAIVGLLIGPFRAYSRFRIFWLDVWCGTLEAKQTVRSLILVVDDEVEIAKNIAERIEQTGKYLTQMAHNGKQALRVLKNNERFLGIAENKVKCIILDIKMPEMDGLQFLKKLRKQEGSSMFKDSGAFHQIPVIILSAYEDIGKISAATDPVTGKVVRYIVKPEKPEHYEELLFAIERVFAGKDQEMITNAYLSGNYRINELRNTR